LIVGAGSKPAQNGTPDKNASSRSNKAGSVPAPDMTDTEYVKMRINDIGRIVEYTWFDLDNHIDNIKLHKFIVMPNHVHGIVEITNDNRAGLEPAPTGSMISLSEIIRQMKTFSARRINQLRKTLGRPVWQRNYYEHIIRDENAHHQLSEYIKNNPMKWREDKYYAS